MNTPQQSQKVVWLVRTLVSVGLAMVVTTTGFVGWTLAGMRRERSLATAEQARLDAPLHQFREKMGTIQRDIATQLDENADWQPSSPSALEQFTVLVRTQLHNPGNPAIVPLLQDIEGQAQRLSKIAIRAGIWRQRYLPLCEDLRVERTVNSVREIIAKLDNAMDTVDGQRRLAAAIEYKHWREATGPEAARLAERILLDQGYQESEGVTDFDGQLAELARLVEVLGGEEQFDDMTNLKDNLLKPVIERLGNAVDDLVAQGVYAEFLSSETVEELRVALFGKGYRSDDLRQNIQLGRGGLFTLRLDVLGLRREREKIKAELSPLLLEVQSTSAALADSTQVRSAALTREMELSLTNGWTHMLLFGSGCAVLFLWLARLIARGIRDQVQAIEQARAESEASRQTAQQLMGEQLRAAEELKAANRSLLVSEVRFRTLSNSAPVGIFATDANGMCTYTNTRWDDITARPSVESLGMGWFGMVHPDDLPGVSHRLQQAVADQCLYDHEYRIVRPNGEARWVHVMALPERSPEGSIVGSVGTIEDITGRKHSEEEMRKMHQELVETSRQAGMAEVATAVLHNVGNVLNSVNIASHCLAEGVRRSRASSLTRVVAMLREHEGDLNTFFTEHTQGKQVIGFLGQLAEHFVVEQNAALTELANLQKNIEHIKEVVAMQQGFARICGVTETLQISELVEDTLRLNASSLANHEVKVKCEFTPVPAVTVEKHKVLQILVNLVRNAKHACEASDRKDKLVRLRVANGEEGRIRISVTDNGVGIAPENLARIFNHGFTTKKTGHGFGLHSGALAAREMGGALLVESQGPGFGATFILELPLSPSKVAKGPFSQRVGWADSVGMGSSETVTVNS
jgi:PAS domain S-box-containing protein